MACSLAAIASAGATSNTPIESAVAELGRIHGTALACKQPALVSRARNAVQTTAPKTRAYGEIYAQTQHKITAKLPAAVTKKQPGGRAKRCIWTT